MLRKEPFRKKAFSLRNKMSDVRDDYPAFIGRGLKSSFATRIKNNLPNERVFLSVYPSSSLYG